MASPIFSHFVKLLDSSTVDLPMLNAPLATALATKIELAALSALSYAGLNPNIPETLTVSGIFDPIESDPLVLTRSTDHNGYPRWTLEAVGIWTLFYENGWILSNDTPSYYAIIETSALLPIGLTGWNIGGGDGQPSISGDYVAGTYHGQKVKADGGWWQWNSATLLWEIMGTGDMRGSDNLAGITDPGFALQNLGGGAVGIAMFQTVGTGATAFPRFTAGYGVSLDDAVTYLTNLGFGAVGRSLAATATNTAALTSLNSDGALDAALCMPVSRTIGWTGSIQTNVGTGSSSIADCVNLTSGATSASSAVIATNNTVQGWGAGVFDQQGKSPNWTKRVTIGFSISVIVAPSANARFGVRLGFVTVGDMAKRGIGIIVEGTALKMEVHNGIARSVSSSLKTVVNGECVYVTLQAYQGTLKIWLNGVFVTSISGAPTTNEGLSNQETFYTHVMNNADATNNRWQVSPATLRVTL